MFKTTPMRSVLRSVLRGRFDPEYEHGFGVVCLVHCSSRKVICCNIKERRLPKQEGKKYCRFGILSQREFLPDCFHFIKGLNTCIAHGIWARVIFLNEVLHKVSSFTSCTSGDHHSNIVLDIAIAKSFSLSKSVTSTNNIDG